MKTKVPLESDIILCAARNAIAIAATRKPADIAFDIRWGRDCVKSCFRFVFGELRSLAKGTHRFGPRLSPALADSYGFKLPAPSHKKCDFPS